MQPSDHGTDLDPATAALAAAAMEIARELPTTPLARTRWYALVRTADLLAQHPSVAALMGEEAATVMGGDDLHLTPVDLDDDEEERPTAGADPLAELAALNWPSIAAGGAVACSLPADRVELRGDEHDLSHAGDGPLTVVAAALPDSATFCALRQEEGRFAVGPALLPQIAQALVESLRDQRQD